MNADVKAARAVFLVLFLQYHTSMSYLSPCVTYVPLIVFPNYELQCVLQQWHH